jgi:hypothetical protein
MVFFTFFVRVYSQKANLSTAESMQWNGQMRSKKAIKAARLY